MIKILGTSGLVSTRAHLLAEHLKENPSSYLNRINSSSPKSQIGKNIHSKIDLRPCLPEVVDRDYGNRNISAREHEELKKQNRLLGILKETQKNLGTTGMSVMLIDELCNLNGGLKDQATRQEILYLTYHAISDGYITNLLSLSKFNEIKDRMQEANKLIPCLKKHINPFLKDKPDRSSPKEWPLSVLKSAAMLINASLEKHDGIVNLKKSDFFKLIEKVLEAGFYGDLDSKALDAYGKDKVLAILTRLAENGPEFNIDRKYSDLDLERRRQGLDSLDSIKKRAKEHRSRKEEIQSARLLNLDTNLTRALNSLQNNPLNLTEAEYRILFKENNDIGFTALREFARASNSNASSALTIELARRGYKEETSFMLNSGIKTSEIKQVKRELQELNLDSIENNSPAPFLKELAIDTTLPYPAKISMNKIYGDPSTNIKRMLAAKLFNWIPTATIKELEQGEANKKFIDLLQEQLGDTDDEGEKTFLSKCIEKISSGSYDS